MYRKLRVLQTGESAYIIQEKSWFSWKNLDRYGVVEMGGLVVGRVEVYRDRSEAIKSAHSFALKALSKSKFTPRVIWHT